MKLPHRLAALLVSTLCLTALGATGTPSFADGAVTATASNVDYTSDACFNSHVMVAGLDPSSESGQDIGVYAPNRSVVDSEYAFGTDSDSFNVLVCSGSDATGRYTIEVDNAYAGSFTVTKPYFVVHRASRRTVNTQLRLRGRGLGPRRVTVQVAVSGFWIDVLTTRTSSTGRVGVTCKRHHRCPQYFRFNYRDFAPSHGFHLYSGRKNGRLVTGAEARGGIVVVAR